MHHYNFLPTLQARSDLYGASRRDIGHGHLAERAIAAVMPDEDRFLTQSASCRRLSSNGSTSMASVCGSTLALMDAGVPVKARWQARDGAGYRRRRHTILTDIQGLEDLGDMDSRRAPRMASRRCRWTSR